VKICFKDGLKDDLHGRLHHAILNRGNPQHASASLWFRDLHSTHGRETIAVTSQGRFQPVDHLLLPSLGYDLIDSLSVYSRCTPVGFDLTPGLLEHILAIDLVVQTVKPRILFLLGLEI